MCTPRNQCDHWGAYTRHLDPEVHGPGKRHPQKIGRKHLPLRTRITRRVRKTIGFAKSTQRHESVLGFFVNP
jgi:IS1 family transposase